MGRLGVARPIVALLALSSLLPACASEAIAPPHPIFQMEDRIRSRTNIIPLIVRDPERAGRVVDLYIELEDIAATYRAKRALFKARLASLQGDEEDIDERIRAIFEAGKRESVRLGDRYIQVQLEIRKHLSPREFARIDRVR